MTGDTDRTSVESGSAATARTGMDPHIPLVATMALWGSGFVVSKITVAQVPEQVAAAVRFGLGALVLLAALPLLARGQARLRRGEVGKLVVAGVLGVFVYNGVLFYGLAHAPAVDATIIIPVLSPILTTLGGFVLGWERPVLTRVVGVGIGVVGAVLFFVSVTGSGSPDRLFGDVVYLLAAVSWSAYTMVGKRILVDVNPLRATTYSMLFGSVMLMALAAPSAATTAWHALPADFWWTMAYLVIGPTAVAYALFYRGVRDVGPTAASLMMFLVPVSGTVLAALLLGESIRLGQGVGSLLMLVGALLAVLGPTVVRRKGSGARARRE